MCLCNVPDASVITVCHGIRGWFAVHMWWNPEGFYEPWNSSVLSFDTKERAIQDAKAWALSEDLPFKE
jgi:hypothetical protein